MLYLWRAGSSKLGLPQTEGITGIKGVEHGKLIAPRERGDPLRATNGPPRTKEPPGALWEKVYVFSGEESSEGIVPKVAVVINKSSELTKVLAGRVRAEEEEEQKKAVLS